MKYTFLCLFGSIVLLTNAQNKSLLGDYSLRFDTPQGIIEYDLTLNPDGTFVFSYYDKIYNRLQAEKTRKGKGTWKSEKNLVFFFADDSHVDDEFNLNLNNSKARFITKSPRDKSDSVIKTALLFYESEIIKGVKLIKN